MIPLLLRVFVKLLSERMNGEELIELAVFEASSVALIPSGLWQYVFHNSWTSPAINCKSILTAHGFSVNCLKR